MKKQNKLKNQNIIFITSRDIATGISLWDTLYTLYTYTVYSVVCTRDYYSVSWLGCLHRVCVHGKNAVGLTKSPTKCHSISITAKMKIRIHSYAINKRRVCMRNPRARVYHWGVGMDDGPGRHEFVSPRK